VLPKHYKVELLDNTLTPIALVQNFIPLDNQQNYLEYITKLSNYGQCRFRIATKDPLFKTYGDITQPYANFVRVTRNGAIVWQGPVIDNSHRTTNYIQVDALENEYLIKRALLRHDAPDGAGGENYRNFKSGNMQSVIQTLINEAKADYPGTLGRLTAGTIDNPNFPANFTDINNAAIGGQPWQFSDNFQIRFDYRDLFYVINQLGVYAVCDFEITKDFVLNFKSRIGTDKPELVFEAGPYGMVQNFDAPRSGQQMANHLVGVAADTDYNILKAEVTDQASINKYGKTSEVYAYLDVKNINLLRSRLAQQLTLVATPDSELHATLNDKAYPLGQYTIGDGVTLKVNKGTIQVNNLRHIVAIDTLVSTTGQDTIRLVTNIPRPT
jgi:hypothetical protein